MSLADFVTPTQLADLAKMQEQGRIAPGNAQKVMALMMARGMLAKGILPDMVWMAHALGVKTEEDTWKMILRLTDSQWKEARTLLTEITDAARRKINGKGREKCHCGEKAIEL